MIYNDDFNNYEKYNIPKATLILTDIPYCLDRKAYASNPRWWNNGNVKDGRSEKADSSFFENDKEFNIDNFLSFCQKKLN